jgi:hypothetical protein
MDKLRATSDLFGDCIEEDGVIYIGNSESKRELTADEDAKVTTKAIELQAIYDNNQYARDRASAYPSLQDQADMAYWDRQNGTTTLDDAIAAVKDAYPKG